MRLSKTAYYADFAVYGAVITAAVIITGWRSSVHDFSVWLLAVVGGSVGSGVMTFVLDARTGKLMDIGASRQAPDLTLLTNLVTETPAQPPGADC